MSCDSCDSCNGNCENLRTLQICEMITETHTHLTNAYSQPIAVDCLCWLGAFISGVVSGDGVSNGVSSASPGAEL